MITDSHDRIYTKLNDRLIELNSFLDSDGEKLVKFLIEEEVLDHEHTLSILESIDTTFIWLYDRLIEFDDQYATVDAALALIEVFADLVNFMSAGLRGLAQQIPGSDNETLTMLNKILDKVPTIDLSKVNNVIDFFPNSIEVQHLTKGIAAIVGSHRLKNWEHEMVEGVTDRLKQELQQINPPFPISST